MALEMSAATKADATSVVQRFAAAVERNDFAAAMAELHAEARWMENSKPLTGEELLSWFHTAEAAGRRSGARST